MESLVFEIELTNGSIYRVVCMNKKEKAKVVESYYSLGHHIKDVRVLTNGLHSAKDFLKILSSL